MKLRQSSTLFMTSTYRIKIYQVGCDKMRGKMVRDASQRAGASHLGKGAFKAHAFIADSEQIDYNNHVALFLAARKN